MFPDSVLLWKQGSRIIYAGEIKVSNGKNRGFIHLFNYPSNQRHFHDFIYLSPHFGRGEFNGNFSKHAKNL